jgi:hypothetical protein
MHLVIEIDCETKKEVLSHLTVLQEELKQQSSEEIATIINSDNSCGYHVLNTHSSNFIDKIAMWHIPVQLDDIYEEYKKACIKHPRNFNSRHEGYAILLEEVEELWEDIKSDKPWVDIKSEATQIGAMSLRFLLDLNNK